MTEIKNNQHKYVPQQLRAHPFYFYKFPIYVVFLTIIYWLVICPVVYWILLSNFQYALAWSLPFFILSLTIYLILIGILMCIWRCKNRRKYEDIEKCTERSNSFGTRNCTRVHQEKKIISLRPQRSSKKKTSCQCNKNSCTECSNRSPTIPIEEQISNGEEIIDMKDSVDMPQNFVTQNEEREYFVANVVSPKVCVSEVFLFVNDTQPEEKPLEVIVEKK